MVLLDGRVVANEITAEIKEKVASFNRPPMLCIVRVGDDLEAVSYCRGAKKRMEKCGIGCKEIAFSENISNEEFQKEFIALNAAEDIDGIIVMTPMPA